MLPLAALLVNCMSLSSPSMVFCMDARERTVLCDVTGAKPDCQDLKTIFKSWDGHPERKADFYRKLYGK
jgi:hypothetical protein